MKYVIHVIILSVTLWSCGKNNGYEVEGTVSGMDSGPVYLMKVEQNRLVPQDTSELTEGKFIFTGQMEGLPELRYLSFEGNKVFALIFLENEKINVKAFADSLDKTIVSGSPVTEKFDVIKSELIRLNKKVTEMNQAYSQAMMSGDEETVKKLQIDMEAMQENMKFYTKNFIRENKNSVVAPFMTLMQFSQNTPLEELDSMVQMFPSSLDSSIYVIQLNEILAKMRKSAPGVPAPGFTMNDPDGNPVTLSSFKGKYLLIDFWASWCSPCRKENPHVVKMYHKYNDKGFEILGVSLDKSKDAWLKAIKDDKLVWQHVSDLKYWENEVAKLYGVSSIPFTVLLDKEGKILATKLRGKALENKLSEIFD